MYIFSMKLCIIFPILFVLGSALSPCPCRTGGQKTETGAGNVGGPETGGNTGGQETGGNVGGQETEGGGNGGGNSIEVTTAVASPEETGTINPADSEQSLLLRKCRYTIFQKGQDPCGLRKYAQVCHDKGPCAFNDNIGYLPVIGNPYYFVQCGSARISHCQLCAPGTKWHQKELTCIKQ